jgi:peptidoglycan/xylan/chitin deacetylase (PgdA/CDA1 family)
MIFKIIAVVTLGSLVVAAAIVGLAGVLVGWRLPWPLLLTAVALAVEALSLYGVFEPRTAVFGRIFWQGDRDARTIAVTFDDGPNEPYTSRVLDILGASGIKATFFVLGENAVLYPDAVRRAAAEGHEIGNHGYDHTVLPLRSPGYIRSQITRTGDAIERATGARPALFRAPHGWRNPWLGRTARRAGCIPVAWTLGVWDTDRPGAEEIVRRTLGGLAGGCVLLLHDGRGTEHGTDSGQLIAALPAIIRGAREAGYRFVTVSDMIEETRKT